MAFLHRTSLLHDAHTDVARVRLVVVLRRRQHAALATHGQRWAARPDLGAAGRGLEFRAEVPRRGRASRQRYAQRPPSSSRPTGMSSFPRHVGAASLKDKVSSDSATGICPGVAHREPLHPRKGNLGPGGPRKEREGLMGDRSRNSCLEFLFLLRKKIHTNDKHHHHHHTEKCNPVAQLPLRTSREGAQTARLEVLRCSNHHTIQQQRQRSVS